MRVQILCSDQLTAQSAKIALERHWLYEGQGFMQNRSASYAHGICFDLYGPLSSKLRHALEAIAGVDVYDSRAFGRKRAR